MSVQLSAMPEIDNVQTANSGGPSSTHSAIVRVVVPVRRLDRFWQMVRDETPGYANLGTYEIPDENAFKMTLVEIKKPKTEEINNDDLAVFFKYRFKAKIVGDEVSRALDLNGYGTPQPVQYVEPVSKKTTSSAFS